MLVTAHHGVALGAERGSVIPFFAIALPVFMVLLVFVIDVGHWFEHQRHLQLQVDAGALAGGDAFQDCFNGVGSGPNMKVNARNYSGATAAPVAPGPSVYNK